MRPKQIDFDPANVDADGIADGNDSTGSSVAIDGILTSGGSFTSADGLAHRLSIKDLTTDDQTGVTYTFVGTDADGVAQTESRLGPSADATVETLKYFLTLTSIAIASPAATSSVDIGTVDEAASKTFVLDHYENIQPSAQVVLTGTMNFDLQATLENPIKSRQSNNPEIEAPFTFDDQEDLAWYNDANFGGKSASLTAQMGVPGQRAFRIVSNAYTDGAELQVFITQPRNR